MLPKNKRLNLKKDFKWVASGKKLETKYMRLYFRESNPSTGSGPKVGIAVSSKVFKKAVDRNRARRLVSQAFQSTIYNLPATVNILGLPKIGILGVKSDDVAKDLDSSLNNFLSKVSVL